MSQQNFQTTFLALFIGCKLCGLHAFQLNSQSKIIRFHLSDIAIAVLAIFINIYLIHFNLYHRFDDRNVSKLLIVGWSSTFFISGGMGNNLFSIFKDFQHSGYVLKMIQKINRFDGEMKHFVGMLLYNDSNSSWFYCFLSIFIQMLFGIYSIVILSDFDAFKNMMIFFVSYGLFTATYTATTYVYNFFAWAIYRRFFVINQCLW